MKLNPIAKAAAREVLRVKKQQQQRTERCRANVE